MNRFARKIAQLEVEAAALAQDLEHASPETQGRIRARLASVRRSLDWYQARGRSVTALGTQVHDEIAASEAY